MSKRRKGETTPRERELQHRWLVAIERDFLPHSAQSSAFYHERRIIFASGRSEHTPTGRMFYRHCFAERSDALEFQRRFGGELINALEEQEISGDSDYVVRGRHG